jgi:hypothetical protein
MPDWATGGRHNDGNKLVLDLRFDDSATTLCEQTFEELYLHKQRCIGEWMTSFEGIVESAKRNYKNQLPNIPRQCIYDRGVSDNAEGQSDIENLENNMHDRQFMRHGHVEGAACMKLRIMAFETTNGCIPVYEDYSPIDLPEILGQLLVRMVYSTSHDECMNTKLLPAKYLRPIDSILNLKNKATRYTVPVPLCCEEIRGQHMRILVEKDTELRSGMTANELRCCAMDIMKGWYTLSKHSVDTAMQYSKRYGSRSMDDVADVAQFAAINSLFQDSCYDEVFNLKRILLRVKNDIDFRHLRVRKLNDALRCLPGGSMYCRALMVDQLLQLDGVIHFKPLNLMAFWELLISRTGSFFVHGPNWTSLCMVMWMSDANGLWQQKKRLSPQVTVTGHWMKKAQGAGIDTTICETYNSMAKQFEHMASLIRQDWSLQIQQTRRFTAGAIRNMGRIKVQHENNGEPMKVNLNDIDKVGAFIKCTDIRDASLLTLEALCETIDRDKSSLTETLETTDQSESGRKAQKLVSLHLGRPVLIAHNQQFQKQDEVNAYNTLRPVVFWCPTAPCRTNEKTVDSKDYLCDAFKGESAALICSDDNYAMSGTLFLMPYITGTVLGMSSLLGTSQFKIGVMQQQLNTYLGLLMSRSLSFLREPTLDDNLCDRKHRGMIARANVESSMYRLMAICMMPDTKTLQDALNETTNSLQHSVLETHLCIDAMMQTIRQTFDISFVSIMALMINILEIPCLPWDWLHRQIKERNTLEKLLATSLRSEKRRTAVSGPWDLILARDDTDLRAVEDAKHITAMRNFIQIAMDTNMYVGKANNRVCPYWTSPGTATGEPLHTRARAENGVVSAEGGGGQLIRKSCLRTSYTTDTRWSQRRTCVSALVPLVQAQAGEMLSSFNMDKAYHEELLLGALEALTMNKKAEFGDFLFDGDTRWNSAAHFFSLFITLEEQRLGPCALDPKRSSPSDYVNMSMLHTSRFGDGANAQGTSTENKVVLELGFNSVACVVMGSIYASALKPSTGQPWAYFPQPDWGIGYGIVDKVLQVVVPSVLTSLPRGVLYPLGNELTVKGVGSNGPLIQMNVQHTDKINAQYLSRFRRIKDSSKSASDCKQECPLPYVCPWWEDGLHCAGLVNIWESAFTSCFEQLSIARQTKRPVNRPTAKQLIGSIPTHRLPAFTYDFLYDQPYVLMRCGHFAYNNESDLDEAECDIEDIMARQLETPRIGSIVVGTDDMVQVRVDSLNIMRSMPFETLMGFLKENMLVSIPTILRPGAMLRSGDGRYGLLRYNVARRTCLDVEQVCYHCSYYNYSTKEFKNETVEAFEALETSVVCRQLIFLNIDVLLRCNESLSKYILFSDRVMRAQTWFPENESEFFPSRANCLVHVVNSQSPLKITITLDGIIDPEKNRMPIMDALIPE